MQKTFTAGPLPASTSTSKGAKAELKVCQCGALDPMYRGYCKECLTKLKATFDRYLERFRSIQDEYEQYTGKDMKQADEKLRLLKGKIDQYELKLSDT